MHTHVHTHTHTVSFSIESSTTPHNSPEPSRASMTSTAKLCIYKVYTRRVHGVYKTCTWCVHGVCCGTLLVHVGIHACPATCPCYTQCTSKNTMISSSTYIIPTYTIPQHTCHRQHLVAFSAAHPVPLPVCIGVYRCIGAHVCIGAYVCKAAHVCRGAYAYMLCHATSSLRLFPNLSTPHTLKLLSCKLPSNGQGSTNPCACIAATVGTSTSAFI